MPPSTSMVPVTISESASSVSQDACSGGGGGPINGGCGGDPGGRLTGNGSDGHTQFLYEIYPNPNNGRFAISYTAEAESSVRMELVDVTGRTILETTRSVAAGVNELNLDMRDAANGIYLLKLHDGNRTFTAKVAKN